MKGVVIILGFFATVWAQTTNVQQCMFQSNASTLPLNAYVGGCTNPPCLVPQLDIMFIEIFFKSPRLIRSLKTHAHVYILGPIGTSYDLGEEAATCNFITNTYCPLMKDEVIQYRLAMFIESWMPSGTAVTIEFLIRDESDNSPVMCIRVPIRVIPPVNRLTQQTNPAVPLAQQNNSTVPVIVNA